MKNAFSEELYRLVEKDIRKDIKEVKSTLNNDEIEKLVEFTLEEIATKFYKLLKLIKD